MSAASQAQRFYAESMPKDDHRATYTNRLVETVDAAASTLEETVAQARRDAHIARPPMPIPAGFQRAGWDRPATLELHLRKQSDLLARCDLELRSGRCDLAIETARVGLSETTNAMLRATKVKGALWVLADLIRLPWVLGFRDITSDESAWRISLSRALLHNGDAQESREHLKRVVPVRLPRPLWPRAALVASAIEDAGALAKLKLSKKSSESRAARQIVAIRRGVTLRRADAENPRVVLQLALQRLRASDLHETLHLLIDVEDDLSDDIGLHLFHSELLLETLARDVGDDSLPPSARLTHLARERILCAIEARFALLQPVSLAPRLAEGRAVRLRSFEAITRIGLVRV